MSEITRKRLARGTKLMPEHGFGALSSAATQLGAQISADNLADPQGSFRINLQTPALGGSLFLNTGNKGERGHLMIPFVLPPPQQEFSTTGQQDTGDPSYILDEIQVSFDQRAEPCAIMDPTAVGGGLMNFAQVTDAYDIRLSIKEKEMQVFAGSTTPTVPTNEVAALDIPPGFFSGANARVNPAIIGDLEVALNPYRTYVVYVEASSMALSAIDLAMVSLVISLRFKTKLKQRTTSSNQIQNLPTKHNGARTAASVTIQTPAVGSLVLAVAPAGLQTNIETVDGVFLNRLRGGYGKNCDVPPSQNLLVDSCYEVIAVNLFGFSQAITTANIADLPYVGGAPYTGDTIDRRIIPIVYPLTIHHVIAVQSWATTPSTGNLIPSSANLIHEVGVGLATGHRSDAYRYQQVAYHSWNETLAGSAARRLDQIKERSGGNMAGNQDIADMQMFQVPIVNDAGAGATRVGVGYPTASATTGTPVFCGQGITELDARSTIAQGFPAGDVAPVTKGAEQWIEVRWKFGDNVNGLGSGATYPSGTVFVGYGGFWVYLICEKNLSQPGSGGIL